MSGGEKQEAAFQQLKESLANPPVLVFADYTKPYELHTDASREGLGAVLYQKGDDGKLHVIAFGSRSLSKSEAVYETHKLEFLVLKWATNRFHDMVVKLWLKLIITPSLTC